jgi:hypothetical protein
MARTPHTHIATFTAGYSIECTPVASCLNHDGRHNGITLVRTGTRRMVHVGTRTLAERRPGDVPTHR